VLQPVVMQRDTVCHILFQCASVYCSVLQNVAVHCSVLRCAAACCDAAGCRVMQSLAECCRVLFVACVRRYGVATISRFHKITGLFCKISSLLLGSFAKETCNFKESTNGSHPIAVCILSELAGCCKVLQGVAACCSALQCVAVWCRVLQCAAHKDTESITNFQRFHLHKTQRNLQVRISQSVLQCVAYTYICIHTYIYIHIRIHYYRYITIYVHIYMYMHILSQI